MHELDGKEDQQYEEFIEEDEQIDAFMAIGEDEGDISNDPDIEDDTFEFNFQEFNIDTNIDTMEVY